MLADSTFQPSGARPWLWMHGGKQGMSWAGTLSTPPAALALSSQPLPRPHPLSDPLTAQVLHLTLPSSKCLAGQKEPSDCPHGETEALHVDKERDGDGLKPPKVGSSATGNSS